MTITFYYIPAISVNSEPFFADASSRTSILHSKIVKVWDTSYVPPLYTNKIKITTDILPFNLRANYVKIPKFGMDWYYFIDGFTYINETTYFINLSIDAIQTFYFATSFKRFEEKRSLSYKGLRDNLSVDSTLHPYSLVDFDDDKPFIYVIQYKDMSDQGFDLLDPLTGQNVGYDIEDIDENSIILPHKIANNDIKISDGLKTFYLIPNNVQFSFWYYHTSIQYSDENLWANNDDDFMKVIHDILNDSHVINAYATKVYPKGFNYGMHTVDNVTFKGFRLDNNIVLYKNGLLHPAENLQNPTTSKIEIYPYKYGTFTTPIRSICDTNYVQISIGEVNDYAIVPIELLEPSTTYDLYCMLDVCSGSRTYWVNAEPLLNIKFRQVCNSIETLQLFNDNYNIFLMQNKGTLTTGVALQKTQAWANFTNQILNQNAAKAFSGAMQGGVAGGIVAGVESTITSGVDMFTSLYGIEKGVQAQKENAYYSPDTIKLGNNFSNDVFNKFLNKVVIETRVADYQDIIELRKYIGYLAHDVHGHTAMLTLLSSIAEVNGKRLLMGSCELYIPFFGSRDNIVAIKDRLEKGVRFYTDINKLGE